MRYSVIGSLMALTMLAGCTAESMQKIDTTETSALSVPKDVSAADLKLGKEHFIEANYGLAEKHFRKAVELNADNGEAWMGLAASYDQLGRFDFADRAYAQLLKVSGRQPQVVNNMGYSQLLRGNRKEARKLLAEAQRLMPGDPIVEANMKLLAKG
ncbi:MAG: tetratricopeptide repeat protein [Notoacmeibacter sp.]|nr:tetratricopeptide repeat protein [Notoacmeibacter sp.]MCC0031874.1 tetratricopeptide repeat protein [Brucellaceae bacterium]